MPATYPAALRGWSTKRDFQDPIFAANFNQTQDELAAIERTLGLMPQRATNNPARRTPDYGTVTARILASARGEPMIAYRGTHIGAQVIPNEYFRPRLTAVEDTHGMAHNTGFRINQTGYWMITAKADWLATSASQRQITSRMLSLEINQRDVGLRDVLLESDKNRDSMTTTVTWQENLVEGTDITVALHAILADTERIVEPVNVYLRAHLVRCLRQGGPGLPNPNFDPDPPPPPPPPPDDGCQEHYPDDGCLNHTGYQPQGPCGQPYSIRWHPYLNTSATYDSCGNVVEIHRSPNAGTLYSGRWDGTHSNIDLRTGFPGYVHYGF
ncbi:hypothetical protein [Nonomuraea sp. SYSU D8015]|uniref:hypothetical protein n=1 Tax=Nonomuraea sp. SYSU D8015 TaxID=2593644 RepID=UPI001660EC4C|nr:hypothetical protein [Nonomuraea sp. SYSU D8015]